MSETEKFENILRFSVTQNQKSSFVTTQVQMPTTHLQWGTQGSSIGLQL